jgi:carbamoyltransferase
MKVLGTSAFYHDSATAVVRDDEIIAAAQQERFSRNKHDPGFPTDAAAYCLEEAGVTLDDLDYVGFYDKPVLTFGRLLETYLGFAPAGLPSFVTSIPIWVKEKILLKKLILKELNELDRGTMSEDRLLFGFHHHSHAASAFYPSPFDEAAVLVMDAVGEWATTSMGVGSGSKVELLKEIRFPHSLGMLYSAFTYYLGFKVNDGEYKVMGLAPYGEPKYLDRIRDNLIDLKQDGSFRLDLRYFNYRTGLTMTNGHFAELFEGPPRKPVAPLTHREMGLARSIQVITEEIVLRICKALHAETGQKNLCMAGGVALNCVANGRILREGPFERLWIQPAAADAGGAIGVAQA